MEKWERDLADAIHFARKHKEAQKKQYPPQKMELGDITTDQPRRDYKFPEMRYAFTEQELREARQFCMNHPERIFHGKFRDQMIFYNELTKRWEIIKKGNYERPSITDLLKNAFNTTIWG